MNFLLFPIFSQNFNPILQHLFKSFFFFQIDLCVIYKAFCNDHIHSCVWQIDMINIQMYNIHSKRNLYGMFLSSSYFGFSSY